MLWLVDFEVVAQAARRQHRRADQHQRKGGAAFLRLLRLFRRLRLCGLGNRFHRHRRFRCSGIAVLFRQRQQVGFRYRVEEIHIFRIALLVDDQEKHVFLWRGDGVKLLAVLVGGLIHHCAGALGRKGVGCLFLRLAFCRGGLRLVTLCIGRDGQKSGAQAGRKQR